MDEARLYALSNGQIVPTDLDNIELQNIFPRQRALVRSYMAKKDDNRIVVPHIYLNLPEYSDEIRPGFVVCLAELVNEHEGNFYMKDYLVNTAPGPTVEECLRHDRNEVQKDIDNYARDYHDYVNKAAKIARSFDIKLKEIRHNPAHKSAVAKSQMWIDQEIYQQAQFYWGMFEKLDKPRLEDRLVKYFS